MRAEVAATLFLTSAFVATIGCSPTRKPSSSIERVATPSPREIAAGEYGRPIQQEDAERIALARLVPGLKNPDSLRVNWSKVERAWWLHRTEELLFGYALGVEATATNSYDEDVAFDATFYFKDGELVHVELSEFRSSGG